MSTPPTTLREAFVLPEPHDIRAMGFVVRLQEADPASEEVRQLVRDYVVTPVVERELPRILQEMKQVYDRGEEYGRFLHGSFGSGKSHLMTMLGLLLENAAPAWERFRPLFATDPRAWVEEARLLVVRLHMLSVRGKGTGLDRAVYDAFNAALKRRGKAPFEFLNLDLVFDEVRREADLYGDLLWKNLELEGLVGGREDFEQIAAGSPRAREDFARAWLRFKGRSPADAGIDPRWSEGLRRMAEHARSQGFGGVVLMVDEFLLWLAEKSATEFASEINNLNVIVDHNTGQRAAPIFVFVARQRDLREFFPDLVDESKIHEHLDHHAKRFEETRLQDVELRHIVKGRVLRPRSGAQVQAVVDSLAERHQKALPALVGEAGLDYLRDVYPFHPALIEMLVDVTSLMQRERSALRLLYELLVLHYPDLPLGEFLPVGSAFAAVFPEAGVEASKKVELMQEIHQQYYGRLAPAMRRMVEEPALEFSEERRRALDQIVKSVLLAEVSPRLRQAGLTIERLVQLNEVDVEGETFRGKVGVAQTDLLLLAQRVPDLQIAGQGKTALVRYVLGRVSLTEVLQRARSKVDNPTSRFKIFWEALKESLGVQGRKGFEPGGPNEGDWELAWRRTPRRGRLKLGNIREMSNEDFESPRDAFKVLVDYPWDEPGHTVDEDRLRATNARKKLGNRYTACWLPRHLSPSELDVLTELAAVRYLKSDAGQADLLESMGKADRTQLLDQAGTRQSTLEGQLRDLLVEVYVRHGEFKPLISDIDAKPPKEGLAENLEHLATLLMDRRYPQHPHFGAEPRRSDLEALVRWMVQAGEANVSVPYDEQAGRALKTLGQPLELVNLGQTKASLRLDSRYLKEVLQRVDQDSVAWTPIADHLRETYGLPPAVIDTFLCFVCERDHRALAEGSQDPVEVQVGMPAATRVVLQRGRLLSHVEWPRLRDLGHLLFGLRKPPAQRSLQLQDRVAADLRSAGRERRETLQALHQRLAHLGLAPCDRLEEIAEGNARLAPLALPTTDSHRILSELLAAWPEGEDHGLLTVVQEAGMIRDALADLHDRDRDNLRAGVDHPTVGPEAATHLASLEQRLVSRQSEQPLTRDWIRNWNREAAALVKRLIQAPPPPAPRPPSPPPPPPSASKPERVLLDERLDPSDADAVSDFLARVRKALGALNGTRARVVLVREEEVE